MANKQNRLQIDPIAALVERTGQERGLQPASLVGVRIDLVVRSGLVDATVTRTFRNTARQPIEALLSFPVPVNATCYQLSAKMDGRVLKGVAECSVRARIKYEKGLEEGRTAVLHEELLRGIHMLSVGNLRPDTEAEVTMRWVDSVRAQNLWARYRVPMTLGEVYGASGLAETDEPTLGGMLQQVELTVQHDAEDISVDGATSELSSTDGFLGSVPNNTPVDIRFYGWKPDRLIGKSQDGCEISVEFKPAETSACDLDVAVLVDVSGSMSFQNVGSRTRRQTKHSAVTNALQSFAAQVRGSDQISLWEFESECRHVGAYEGVPGAANEAKSTLRSLVRQISRPDGGTDIDRALWISKEAGNRDALLITDGLSYKLDVLSHAQSGRRVFVVLVGEDSLEAKVGHLAAITGGAVYYCFGGDVRLALTNVLRGLRSQWESPLSSALDSGGPLRVVRDGTEITVHWSKQQQSPASDLSDPAVAALAAGIKFSLLKDKNKARDWAATAGLITHLTSLVLVDDDGASQDLAPVQIKVALPNPQTGIENSASMWPPGSDSELRYTNVGWHWPEDPAGDIGGWLSATGRRIDWTKYSARMQAGRLEKLPLGFALVIRILSAHHCIEEFLARFGSGSLDGPSLDGERLAIALVASSVAWRSAPAADVCRTLVCESRMEAFLDLANELFELPRGSVETVFREHRAPN